MFDLKSFFSFNQGDDIETDRQFQIEITDIGIRSGDNPPNLLGVYRIFRGKQKILRACLYLHHD